VIRPPRTTDVLPVGNLPAHGEVSVDLPVPEVALAIAAHPDDAEFGCGATLAKWAKAGCRINHLILTDGSKGTWGRDDDVTALVERRHAEQRAAAAVLAQGEPPADAVRFLDWPDGELEAGMAQRRQVCEVLREVRPDVVLGHDPWRRYRLHPDHRNAGWLVTDGVVAARDPKFFPDLLRPHRPKYMLLWEADDPNHVEDAAGMIEVKVNALLAHRSQYRSTMGIGDDQSPRNDRPPGNDQAPYDDDEVARFRAGVEEQLREHGRVGGVAAGEAFRLLTEI
jgi:LmbE family N-acetylglucosaminyl deacetylase